MATMGLLSLPQTKKQLAMMALIKKETKCYSVIVHLSLLHSIIQQNPTSNHSLEMFETQSLNKERTYNTSKIQVAKNHQNPISPFCPSFLFLVSRHGTGGIPAARSGSKASGRSSGRLRSSERSAVRNFSWEPRRFRQRCRQFRKRLWKKNWNWTFKLKQTWNKQLGTQLEFWTCIEK